MTGLERIAEIAAKASRGEGYMVFNPPLNSPEYAASIRKLLGEPSAPPRSDWPVDTGALIDRHREIASMAVGWAVKHAKIAADLASAEVAA